MSLYLQKWEGDTELEDGPQEPQARCLQCPTCRTFLTQQTCPEHLLSARELSPKHSPESRSTRVNFNLTGCSSCILLVPAWNFVSHLHSRVCYFFPLELKYHRGMSSGCQDYHSGWEDLSQEVTFSLKDLEIKEELAMNNGKEHSRQRAEQVQGHCGGNLLGVMRVRGGRLCEQEGGDTWRMWQIIQGSVAMVEWHLFQPQWEAIRERPTTHPCRSSSDGRPSLYLFQPQLMSRISC